jgi:hypothetical protein
VSNYPAVAANWPGSFSAAGVRRAAHLTLRAYSSSQVSVKETNDTMQCQFPYPMFGPPEGAAGKATAQDQWGIQPVPHYHRLGVRELVRIHDERLARQGAGQHTNP